MVSIKIYLINNNTKGNITKTNRMDKANYNDGIIPTKAPSNQV